MDHKVKRTLVGKYVYGITAGLLGVLFVCGMILVEANADEIPVVPVKGMVTMLDLGADRCIPCKMMIPVMQKVERAYEGKAAVVFIDVWKHNEQARRFRVRAIPTQIFFDASGKEVYRHVGFMNEAAIVEVFKKMGVD